MCFSCYRMVSVLTVMETGNLYGVFMWLVTMFMLNAFIVKMHILTVTSHVVLFLDLNTFLNRSNIFRCLPKLIRF